MSSIHAARGHAVAIVFFLGTNAILASATRAEDVPTLDDIVVTALLRPQPAEQVPASVTVLAAEALHAGGEQHLEDVLGAVPNLSFASGTARARYLQVRGIGELEQYEGAPNPSVGFLIDDVDFSGLGSAATLYDVDRVEVLRGPQGTRYGANALAGLVYVTSASPDAAPGARVDLGVGNYGTRSLGAVVSAPVDALDSAFRLAAQQYKSNGFYTNDYLHRNDTNGRDERTVRARWRYTPSTTLRVDLTALDVSIDDGYDAFSPQNDRITHSDKPGVDVQHSRGLALRAEWTPNEATTLTGIGSWADSRIRYGYDGDWGNPVYWAPYTYDFTELQLRRRTTENLELRLAHTLGDHLRGLVGVYALRLTESLEDTSLGLSIDPINGEYQQNTVTASGYSARNLALFGVLDGDLDGRTHWSFGLRGEYRRADYADVVTDFIAATATPHAFAPSDHLYGGHLSLSRDLATGGSAYVTIARGYKAGGFNLSDGLPADRLIFRPETDLNVEIGYKRHSRDGRWALDVDAFAVERSSAQIKSSVQTDPNNPNTFVFFTGNAGRGFDYGLETAALAEIGSRVRIGATLGLLRTSFTEAIQAADGSSSPLTRELANAPHLNASAYLAYRDPTGRFARIDVAGTSGFYYDLPPNDTRSGGHSLVGTRLGWERPAGAITVWVRNLTNRTYATRGFYFGLVPPDYPTRLYTQLGEPRTFGVDVTLRFGAERRR